MKRNEKLFDLINKNEYDAILLSNENNMHYFCAFSPSEGRILAVKNVIYHIVDSRYTVTAQRHAEKTGLKVIESGVFSDTIKELLKKHNVKAVAFEDTHMSYSDYIKLAKALGITLVPLGDTVSKLRIFKDDKELEMIIAAQRIAEKAYEQLLNDLKAGKTEREMAALLDYYMRKSGSDGTAFDTILISGANTSMPHGVPGDNKIENGDFVTMDFGATYGGYRSDMTRTVAIGSCTDEMKKVYHTVLEAQKEAIDFIHCGVLCKDAYNAAFNVIDKAGYGECFRHGLGHGVGIEIHEGYSCSPSSADVLTQGCITTVEPGIYLPERFGVRIEDMLYIKEDKTINITKTPKELLVL